MTLNELNQSDKTVIYDLFSQCCTATRWIQGMVEATPYASLDRVKTTADRLWSSMETADYQEAFDGHPKIGDPASLKKKYAATHDLAAHEQASVALACDKTLAELVYFNRRYEERFGYIFIVCATGKSAAEMLRLIKQRIDHPPEDEIVLAAEEQRKIMQLRIDRLLRHNPGT